MSEKLFEIPVTLTIHATATVYAETPAEAIGKAEEGKFESDGRAMGELVNWRLQSYKPKEA